MPQLRIASPQQLLLSCHCQPCRVKQAATCACNIAVECAMPHACCALTIHLQCCCSCRPQISCAACFQTCTTQHHPAQCSAAKCQQGHLHASCCLGKLSWQCRAAHALAHNQQGQRHNNARCSMRGTACPRTVSSTYARAHWPPHCTT